MISVECSSLGVTDHFKVSLQKTEMTTQILSLQQCMFY